MHREHEFMPVLANISTQQLTERMQILGVHVLQITKRYYSSHYFKFHVDFNIINIFMELIPTHKLNQDKI
jgi:hypothetical protein